MAPHLKSEQDKSKSPATSSDAPEPLSGTGGALYIVATPIGNLGDMTYRAVETLKTVSRIACEDTRVSATLLRHYDIRTPTFSYHEHNAAKERPRLLAALAGGESVALISDAGTPLISDPGYKLVEEAREQNIPVIPVPGASSITAAISAAGLPTDRFYFAGFLPSKAQARIKAIAALAPVSGTLILLESANRLADSLAALAEGLPDRQAVVAREITKRFEEFRRGSLQELATYYKTHEARGEIVLLISAGEERALDDEALDAMLRDCLATLSVREAASEVAKMTGVSRSKLYQRALELKPALP